MDEITEELMRMSKAFEALGQGPSLYRIVLEHGRSYKAQPLPEGIERAKPRECFANALSLALGTGWDYVEGYGMRPSIGWPIHHAWCADEDGRVIDPTWDNPEEASYYGIAFDVDHVIGLGYTGLALEDFARRVLDEAREA